LAGWYETMSDTRARASRWALVTGSFCRNGLMTRVATPLCPPAGFGAGAGAGGGATGAGGGGAAGRGGGGATGAAATGGSEAADVDGRGGIAGAAGRATGGAVGAAKMGRAGAAWTAGGGGGTITAGATTATGGGWGKGGTTTCGAALAASATPTGKTARHTEHRARTPPAGTFAGSTRNTVAHSGQVTFIGQSPSSRVWLWRRSTTNTEPGNVLA